VFCYWNRHLDECHQTSDRSTAQVKVQMEIVGQLECQVCSTVRHSHVSRSEKYGPCSFSIYLEHFNKLFIFTFRTYTSWLLLFIIYIFYIWLWPKYEGQRTWGTENTYNKNTSIQFRRLYSSQLLLNYILTVNDVRLEMCFVQLRKERERLQAMIEHLSNKHHQQLNRTLQSNGTSLATPHSASSSSRLHDVIPYTLSTVSQCIW